MWFQLVKRVGLSEAVKFAGPIWQRVNTTLFETLNVVWGDDREEFEASHVNGQPESACPKHDLSILGLDHLGTCHSHSPNHQPEPQILTVRAESFQHLNWNNGH